MRLLLIGGWLWLLFQSNLVLADSQYQQRVAEAFKHWQEHSGNVFDLLADNATWRIEGSGPLAKTYLSKQAILTEVIQPFGARMATPFTPTVRHIYSDGNTVIVVWDGEGQCHDGSIYRNSYSWFMTFDGDKVTDVVAFFDTQKFNQMWQRVVPQ